MKVIIAVVAALCMFQGLNAMGVTKHRRDTDLQQHLNEMMTNAQSAWNNLLAQWQSHAPSTDEALQKVKTTAETMAQKMQEVATQLTEQAHTATGSLSEALNTVAANMNATVANFRSQHPEAAHQHDVYREQLQTLMQSMMDGGNKMKTELEGPMDSMKQSISTITENGLTEAKRLLEQAQQHLSSAAAH